MKKTETCYMCESTATSREHAPPRCIFPEQKDTQNRTNFRKNLIKVPSCDAHNTEKSKEDSYLMHILPISIGTNDVGINQFLTKIQRAIARRPKLFEQIVDKAKPVLIHDTIQDKWFHAAAINVDESRIHKIIEMNARAIYFHKNHKKFIGKITVHTNFTLDLNNRFINDTQEELFNMSNALLNDSPALGENPEVFSYRFARENNIELLEFKYYGFTKGLAILHHN